MPPSFRFSLRTVVRSFAASPEAVTSHVRPSRTLFLVCPSVFVALLVSAISTAPAQTPRPKAPFIRSGVNQAERRTAESRVALTVPHTDAPHTPASMTPLFGQALGLYLGLAPSQSAAEMMGPDSHAPNVVRTLSTTDVARAKTLMQTRAMLVS